MFLNGTHTYLSQDTPAKNQYLTIHYRTVAFVHHNLSQDDRIVLQSWVFFVLLFCNNL